MDLGSVDTWNMFFWKTVKRDKSVSLFAVHFLLAICNVCPLTIPEFLAPTQVYQITSNSFITSVWPGFSSWNIVLSSTEEESPVWITKMQNIQVHRTQTKETTRKPLQRPDKRYHKDLLVISGASTEVILPARFSLHHITQQRAFPKVKTVVSFEISIALFLVCDFPRQ